jgi:hypothetical protein
MVRRALLAGVLSLVAGSALGPGLAAAAQPACGQVVTQDVRLEADLHCAGDGPPALIIGADGVTVDLAGHALSDDIASIGIDNTGGHDRVTISGGSVSAGRAIVLQDASRNLLVNLQTGGVTVTGGERNEVRDSTLAGPFGNRIPLSVDGSDRIRIVGNTLSGGFVEALDLTSDGSLVEGNDVSRAIFVTGSGNRIVGNFVKDGFTLPNLVVQSGTGNVIRRNWVFGSQVQIGILLNQGANGTVVSENVLAGSGTDGIAVAVGATGTTLRRNFAVNNADDGIDVGDPSTLLLRNTANDNGDLGIEAVAGVTGVGNRASGNGNPLQCVNVTCT